MHTPFTRSRRALPLTALLVPLALAGCGDSTSGSADAPIDVQITADGCDPREVSATSGDDGITFSYDNAAPTRGEFEIVSSEPAIVFESYLDPDEAKTSSVLLRPGTYTLICGSTTTPNRGRLVVEGNSATATAPIDAELADATAAYQAYVVAQARRLQTQTTRFTDAVRAGDNARAKALYAEVRIPWERIEPIAEAFPDADAAIDSRADDHAAAEADPGFVGFHAIEYGLWAQGTKNGARVDLPALANRLDKDVAALVGEVEALELSAPTMVNGAAALIDEAAQTKVTGEEERYSNTDLTTLASNLAGARKVLELVDEPLRERNPQLRDDIRRSFQEVNTILNGYRAGEGYESYLRVTEADRNRLKTSMAGLSELLSQVAGSLGLEVQG